jgi:hypothetical protein
VTDQSSPATEVFVRIACLRAIPPRVIPESVSREDTDGRFPFRGQPRCIVCGQTSRFIDPFRE